MADLLTATQDAIFDALNIEAVTDLATVVQHIPDEAALPLAVIGSIRAENIGGKDGGLEQHNFEIVYFWQGEARRGLYALMQAGRDAIEQADLEAPGAIFGDAVWQSSDDDLADDGVTYQGLQSFEVIVQPDE